MNYSVISKDFIFNIKNKWYKHIFKERLIGVSLIILNILCAIMNYKNPFLYLNIMMAGGCLASLFISLNNNVKNYGWYRLLTKDLENIKSNMHVYDLGLLNLFSSIALFDLRNNQVDQHFKLDDFLILEEAILYNQKALQLGYDSLPLQVINKIQQNQNWIYNLLYVTFIKCESILMQEDYLAIFDLDYQLKKEEIFSYLSQEKLNTEKMQDDININTSNSLKERIKKTNYLSL